MPPSQDLIKKLTPQYFWDVDRDTLDDTDAKRLIIERVFSLGNLNEITLVINHYGREETQHVLCSLQYLDPKTLNFVSKLMNLHKKKFACFNRSQFRQKFWNS